MINSDVKFWKLSGSGNDFVCIDNRDRQFDQIINDPQTLRDFSHAICHRGKGVGADGIIFAETSEVDAADIFARFIESDGSHCELCGNGTGCFTNFVINTGIVEKDIVKILTPAGIVLGKPVDTNYIRVCIPQPEFTERNFSLEIANQELTCDFTVVGIPHVVTYVDDLNVVEVNKIGYAIRHHDKFKPRGTNVNFVKPIAPCEIELRTFEFGVEGETLACGTGSSAAAILSALKFGWDSHHEFRTGKPITVHTKGGQKLRVYFSIDPDTKIISDVCLETTVRKIYAGEFAKDFLRSIIQEESEIRA